MSPSILSFYYGLRNGFSFFYGDRFGNERFYPIYEFRDYGTLFDRFKSTAAAFVRKNESVSIARRFCHQLLALRYGRRELHPGDLSVRDENLKHIRLCLDHCSHQSEVCRQFIAEKPNFWYLQKEEAIATTCQRELQALVDQFDVGPLTMQQLERIAIRRSLGGIDFERRVRSLSSLRVLSRPLFKYVAKGELEVSF